jgi:hypothetical protein
MTPLVVKLIDQAHCIIPGIGKAVKVAAGESHCATKTWAVAARFVPMRATEP